MLNVYETAFSEDYGQSKSSQNTLRLLDDLLLNTDCVENNFQRHLKYGGYLELQVKAYL